MRSRLPSRRPLLRAAAPLTFGLFFAALVVDPARAGHVLLDVEGTARVAASDDDPFDGEGNESVVPVVFPGGTPLEVTAGEARAALDYSLSESRFVVSLATHGVGDPYGGEGTAELVVRFSSDLPLLFSLVVASGEDPGFGGYGNRLYGEIDGRRVSFVNRLEEPDNTGTKTLSGRLPAGQHEFAAFNHSSQDRGTGIGGAGLVELEVTAIPLPASGWTGLAGVGAVAFATLARGRLAPRRCA